MATEQSAPAAERPAAQPAAEQEPTNLKMSLATQQALAARRYERSIMAELGKKNWGQNLDALTLRAISDWGERHGIDAAQEIDVLGNRIYLNARFYLRGLAHLIEAGRVQYVDCDNVAADPRIPLDSPEFARRRDLRIQYNLPDKALAAVVARVKLRNVPVEFSAAKWCGNKGNNKNGNLKDPIGEEYPVETAETRALRRCLRLMVTHIPAEDAKRIQVEDEAVEIEELVQASRERAKTSIDNRLPRPLSDGDYSGSATAPVQRGLPAGGQAMEHPYGEERAAAPDRAVEGAGAEPEFQDDRHLAND